MKKKGFTLVELLAVIAILAILVIIALPNVMGMFNNAKKSSFETEVKEVLKGAQQQWMQDSITGGVANTCYTTSSSGCRTKTFTNTTISVTPKSLTSVDIRSQLKYYIELNGTGKITLAQFSDGTYWYNSGEVNASGDNLGLRPEDVKTESINVTADNAVPTTNFLAD